MWPLPLPRSAGGTTSQSSNEDSGAFKGNCEELVLVYSILMMIAPIWTLVALGDRTRRLRMAIKIGNYRQDPQQDPSGGEPETKPNPLPRCSLYIVGLLLSALSSAVLIATMSLSEHNVVTVDIIGYLRLGFYWLWFGNEIAIFGFVSFPFINKVYTHAGYDRPLSSKVAVTFMYILICAVLLADLSVLSCYYVSWRSAMAESLYKAETRLYLAGRAVRAVFGLTVVFSLARPGYRNAISKRPGASGHVFALLFLGITIFATPIMWLAYRALYEGSNVDMSAAMFSTAISLWGAWFITTPMYACTAAAKAYVHVKYHWFW